MLVAGAILALWGCGGDDEDPRSRVVQALARVPIADAYDLRVALREPGGRRRIVKLQVDARELPRPSGTWRATYEVDEAGRTPYVVESAARRDVVSVSVGRTPRQAVPAEVGRRVTFASRLPSRVLDSPFVLAPYDRSTIDPTAWPVRLAPVSGAPAGVERLEGPAASEVVLEDLRGFVGSVVGDEPARNGATGQGAVMAVDVGPTGQVDQIVARVGIAGGGRASVQLRTRRPGRGGLETVRAQTGAPLRAVPRIMRGAVPPRVRAAFGVGAP